METKDARKKLIFARLERRNSDVHKAWVSRNFSYSRIVGNDLSEFLNETLGSAVTTEGKGKNVADENDQGQFEPQEVYEGMPNQIAEYIQILIDQVAFGAPQVQIEDLDPLTSLIHAKYLETRWSGPPLGQPSAWQMKKALFDCLIKGIGFVGLAFKRGLPQIKHLRCEDIIWDPNAETIWDATWCSIRRTEKLGSWLEMFPKDAKKFAEFMAGEDKSIALDTPITLEFYYDIDGEKGHSAIIIVGKDEPMEMTDNPFYYQTSEQDLRLPFLPIEPIATHHVPGRVYASGLVEQMLSHWVKLCRNERRRAEVLDIGKPRIGVDIQAVDGKSRNDILDPSDIPDVLQLAPGKKIDDVIGISTGFELPAWMDSDRAYHAAELRARAGVNPYVSGQAVAGFSSEAIAINSHGDLTKETVAMAYALAWQRIGSKFLQAAIQYDDHFLRIVHEDVAMVFGPENPIGHYLVPEAKLVIQPDTTMFQTKADRAQIAQAKMQAALQMAQFFPSGVAKAYEDLLIAYGERNPAPWMEQPQMAQPMQAGSAGAGGVQAVST